MALESFRRWPCRALICVGLIGSGAAAPALAADLETRIDGLEARLEGLTRRVQALETVLKESGPDSARTAAPKGEPSWELDDYSRESPLQVVQRDLDRETGRVDLLLSVTGPIPDAAAWSSLEKGTPVPILITLDLGGGATGDPLPLRLERATSLEPGSRIHLSAQLEPGVAKRVHQIQVTHGAADLN